MRIHDRDLGRIIAAPLGARHWRALGRMVTTYAKPVEALGRYLRNDGRYPWRPVLRTPTGIVQPLLLNYHDLLTVNEVFCRQDYGGDKSLGVVMDIGANVGLATLYFLTRNSSSRAVCYEPDPENVERLRTMLKGFEDRYIVVEKAVTPTAVDRVEFVAGGRYGHTASEGETGVVVPAVGIVEALDEVLGRLGDVDLVKIDTEGSEPSLVAALLASPQSERVGRVVYEDAHGRTRWVAKPTRA